MQLPHPQYPGIKILVGEKARPGSWIVPTSGKNLSHYANQAYGAGTLPNVLKINRSAWNRGNLVYRKLSTSCVSPQVDSSIALSQNSFSAGAWVALCQGDTPSWARTLGLNYPPIWIPGAGGEEPGDLVGGPTTGQILIGTGGEADLVQLIPGVGDSETSTRVPEKSGGFKLWHGLAIAGAIVVVGGVAIAVSKKKKKRGKKR